jgi:hypothetical protein
MRRALLISPLLTLCLGSVHAQETDEAKLQAYRHASACVAVLKHEALNLTASVKAGRSEARPDLVRVTELGFGFIGTAYKSGLRKPQADQMLTDAEQEQKKASPEALRHLLAACRVEGDKLLSDANFIERALVSNRAQSRVDKLLAPPADKPN